jgi:hypothetical protein
VPTGQYAGISTSVHGQYRSEPAPKVLVPREVGALPVEDDAPSLQHDGAFDDTPRCEIRSEKGKWCQGRNRTTDTAIFQSHARSTNCANRHSKTQERTPIIPNIGKFNLQHGRCFRCFRTLLRAGPPDGFPQCICPQIHYVTANRMLDSGSRAAPSPIGCGQVKSPCLPALAIVHATDCP